MFIVIESSAEPDVMEALTELGLPYFTRWGDVAGNGETGRREGTAIFPGLNTVLLVVLPDERVEAVVHRLHEIRDSFIIRPGMKIIVTDCMMY